MPAPVLPAWVDEGLHDDLCTLHQDVNDSFGEARAMTAVLESVNEVAVRRAVSAVEDGCPTKKISGKPCAGCVAAAERVRKCLA